MLVLTDGQASRSVSGACLVRVVTVMSKGTEFSMGFATLYGCLVV